MPAIGDLRSNDFGAIFREIAGFFGGRHDRNKWKAIDRDWLKIIAIIAMTMDHIAGSFFTGGSAIWLIFRIIG